MVRSRSAVRFGYDLGTQVEFGLGMRVAIARAGDGCDADDVVSLVVAAREGDKPA